LEELPGAGREKGRVTQRERERERVGGGAAGGRQRWLGENTWTNTVESSER